MSKLKMYIVDVGNAKDMHVVASLITSEFGENECAIRNENLFVSRLVPVVPALEEGSVNNTVLYPL
jgi:hypothetical protein